MNEGFPETTVTLTASSAYQRVDNGIIDAELKAMDCFGFLTKESIK